MHYVYIIESISSPGKTYIGYSSDLKTRFKHHNEGRSIHTSKYRPWKILWYCAFQDKIKALQFEEYLKNHSGKAFASKHLL